MGCLGWIIGIAGILIAIANDVTMKEASPYLLWGIGYLCVGSVVDDAMQKIKRALR